MSLPDKNAEIYEQNRSQQQLNHTENHRHIAKNTSFPDGNGEKNEQSRSQQQL